jgi:two-component system nitrogen regulation response regulator NtrX
LSKRVLVFDDDPLVLELIQIILESEGHEVTLLDTADNAVQRVAEVRPDLVFLDIVMQTRHGMEVLAELREALPDIPVVLLSGAVTQVDDMPAIARGLGASGFLEKPFDAQKLVALVNGIGDAVPRAP